MLPRKMTRQTNNATRSSRSTGTSRGRNPRSTSSSSSNNNNNSNPDYSTIIAPAAATAVSVGSSSSSNEIAWSPSPAPASSTTTLEAMASSPVVISTCCSPRPLDHSDNNYNNNNVSVWHIPEGPATAVVAAPAATTTAQAVVVAEGCSPVPTAAATAAAAVATVPVSWSTQQLESNDARPPEEEKTEEPLYLLADTPTCAYATAMTATTAASTAEAVVVVGSSSPTTAAAAAASSSSSSASTVAAAATVARRPVASLEDDYDDDGRRYDGTSSTAVARAYADEEDSELLAMKRAAAYGGGGSSSGGISSNYYTEYTASVIDDPYEDRQYVGADGIMEEDQGGVGVAYDAVAEEAYLDPLDVGSRVASATATATVEEYREDTQAAVVLGIDEEQLHPSDLDYDYSRAAEAEFVRAENEQGAAVAVAHTSYSASLERQEDAAVVATSFSEEFGIIAEVEDENNQTAEATVIDSTPIDPNKEVVAQVLEADSGSEVPNLDSKPPARELSGRSASDDYAVADEEAAVLDIQEDIHPSEFVHHDHAAEAELVGTDDYYAYTESNAVSYDLNSQQAVPQHFGDSSQSLTATAVLAGESLSSSSEPGPSQTAEATLVGEEYAAVDEVEEVTHVGTPMLATAMDAETQPDTGIYPEKYPSQPPTRPLSPEPHPDPPSDPTAAPPVEPHEPLSDTVDANTPPEFLHTPAPTRFADTRLESMASSTGVSELSVSSSQRGGSLQCISHSVVRGTGNVIEALFGEDKPAFGSRNRQISSDDAASSILPRTLLPWSVIRNPDGTMWVATLQTNQKALDSNDVMEASKSLRAFSLPTEKQAICLARAWTPPRMYEFTESKQCHICRTKFALLRRACHCRNCGVVICKDCTKQWPAKMIPETYNTKRGSTVNVCKSCDWLCSSFRLALLEGIQDKAVALHATGNINLHAPFANVKGELFYPVHCAVLGQNLELVKWLVDENCCPIKSVRVGGKTRESAGKYTPIVTSKGRSLLGIAMEHADVEIVRYLVVQKGIALAGEKDITTAMLISNLDAALRRLPTSSTPTNGADPALFESEDAFTYSEGLGSASDDHLSSPPPPTAPFSEEGQNGRSLSDEARDFGAILNWGESADDECIICFDSKIDCVATPCGHQICCLKCSGNVSRCPVCAADCEFLRVFKP